MSDTTELQVLENVPNDKVKKKVAQIIKNPRYIDHKVIPEPNNTSRIEVTLRKNS